MGDLTWLQAYAGLLLVAGLPVLMLFCLIGLVWMTVELIKDDPRFMLSLFVFVFAVLPLCGLAIIYILEWLSR